MTRPILIFALVSFCFLMLSCTEDIGEQNKTNNASSDNREEPQLEEEEEERRFQAVSNKGNIETLTFLDISSGEGEDDCDHDDPEACKPIPLSVCHFASHLGSLAIVEMEELSIDFEGVHCERDIALSVLKLKVWAVIAGDDIPDEITVYAKGPSLGFFNKPGRHAIIEINKFRDKFIYLASTPIDIETTAPDNRTVNSRTRLLPTSFDEWVDKANMVSIGEIDCEEYNSISASAEEYEAYIYGNCD